MKLLLAEDDAMLGASMEKGLTLAGFTLDRFHDGQHVLNALESHSYDVILLDIGLPKIDGLQILRRMRQQGLQTPVLLVTARDAVHDRVAGLNLGADDYLSKPFDLDELTARIHALARRQIGRSQPQLQLGRLLLDPIERQARLGDTLLALSPREFDLLETLMRQPGAVLSLDLLEKQLYTWGNEVTSNAVEVHLHHLRKKLGEPWIVNVRGVGYKLVPLA
ncbi:MAG: DNA-binding response regulator [Burkholderiales bacterium RIFCSPLOWO2_12_67_14]|nr:MAG: DNA-binding response regulator [Burkholderiales bacterium RIFCSPLOWO2_02_FULL_67_64]OGB40215.1 MAG: DNA-binding response regulator [Burkholderiales bacterium RIFCSPLOWO2_12_67_14]OGB49000.1 MAG: DNA-binding response regulator [Burkholderiales bacterium RIFCSPHIGHO2_12_FULL_67_38]OGB98557.1 MAG: DNA-binding response regulator [Burkholderiales bacterium RIFCSPLOWO2_12_FULL_67_210]